MEERKEYIVTYIEQLVYNIPVYALSTEEAASIADHTLTRERDKYVEERDWYLQGVRTKSQFSFLRENSFM